MTVRTKPHITKAGSAWWCTSYDGTTVFFGIGKSPVEALRGWGGWDA